MTIQAFKNAGLWVDGAKLDSQIRATRLEYGAEALDATTISDNTRVRAGGLKDITLTHEGYWDATASSSGIDAVLFDSMGDSSTPVTIAPQNSSEGSVAYLFKSITTEYSPRAAVGELFGYGVSATADSDLARGILLRNSTGINSGSLSGTVFQLAASSSTTTLVANLHVIAADGNGMGSTEALLMRIQSAAASSFSGLSTEITFVATTASTSQYQSVTGSSNTWFRAIATTPSSSGEFWAVVSLGVSTN